MSHPKIGPNRAKKPKKTDRVKRALGASQGFFRKARTRGRRKVYLEECVHGLKTDKEIQIALKTWPPGRSR